MEFTTIEISEVDTAFAEMIMRRYQLEDAWLYHFLSEMMAKTRCGHICIEVKQEEIARLPDCLLGDHGLLKLNGVQLYFQRYWYLETKLLLPIIRRIKRKTVTTPGSLSELNQEQNDAVACAMSHQLSIIMGGPGTGKTHTIAHLVKQFSGKRIALTAPTGKAVSKLSDSIEAPDCTFQTLHTLLGIKQAKDVLEARTLLPYDVVIVDECSMIDIGMWGALLEACALDTKLVLVGDAHQLPPIEGGHVFEQLCQFFQNKHVSGLTKLITCMRTDRKALKNLAAQILNGQIEDISLVDLPTASNLASLVKPAFRQKFDHTLSHAHLFEEMKKFQILSALRKGPEGCDALNNAIFAKIKEGLGKQDTLAIPIIVTRNAPHLGLSNGDMGIWLHGEEDKILFKDKTFPKALAPPFELAYVLSVHKSQGSEYEHVYLLLPTGSEHFGRSVLYTAVTRAQSQLTIASDYDTVRLCAQNNVMRLAGLSERLGEMLCKN